MESWRLGLCLCFAQTVLSLFGYLYPVVPPRFALVMSTICRLWRGYEWGLFTLWQTMWLALPRPVAGRFHGSSEVQSSRQGLKCSLGDCVPFHQHTVVSLFLAMRHSQRHVFHCSEQIWLSKNCPDRNSPGRMCKQRDQTKLRGGELTCFYSCCLAMV